MRPAATRRLVAIAGLAGLLAAGLVATAVVPAIGHDERTPRARTQIEQSLSGIDFLPNRSDLSEVLAGSTELVALANSTDDSVSPGVRVRAFRSLGLFDDPVARAGLTDAIARFSSSNVPMEQLYLIAAIEAFGDIAVDTADVALLAAGFSHSSRDVRAAVVRALYETNLPAICAPLRNQAIPELEQQVSRAIEEALSALRYRRICS